VKKLLEKYFNEQAMAAAMTTAAAMARSNEQAPVKTIKPQANDAHFRYPYPLT